MQRILIVEDNKEIQRIMKDCLNEYELHQVSNLKDAEAKLSELKFDLMILDVGLPDGDGMKFFAKMQSQKAKSETAVIFVTGQASTEDVVMGFQLGAEDYVTKPFNLFEFRARVQSRLRAANKKDSESSILNLGGLILDLARHRAMVDDGNAQTKTLELTPLEFKLLVFFARNEEQVFNRDQIIDQVWGQAVAISDRAVDTHISNLRKKIISSGYTLSSIYGTGYTLRKKDKLSA